ncbi:MAG: O-antigen ligase family protein [Bacteroidales bacterium]
MKALSSRYLNFEYAEQAAWFLVWFSLPISLKMNSASLILVSAVILASFARRPFMPQRRKIWYLSLPVVFFLWHSKELLIVHPAWPVWKEVEQMLSFLVIPILFLLSRTDHKAFAKVALSGFTSALVICGTIMLVAATSRFLQSGNVVEFTYHTLAKPFHSGAIYFSFYILFVLFKLDDPDWFTNRLKIKVIIAFFLMSMLLLLASKMMIGIGLPLLGWHYRRLGIALWRTRRKWMVALVILIAFGALPFMKRVQNILHPNLDMVASVNFKNCPEPNGLNLRLIFWRFGMEILEEQNAWLTGVGMSQSRGFLNGKIRQYGLYTGTPDGKDSGYLNYNYHNQFVETFVRVGVPGVVILMLILFTFAFHPGNKRFVPPLFILIIIGFFLSESVLGRQAGIVFFCLAYAADYIDGYKPINNENP